MRRTNLLVFVAFMALLALPAPSSAKNENARQLRHSVSWHRARAWHWQDLRGVPRTPTTRAEAHTRSTAFLRWLAREWSDRRVRAWRAYRQAASASVPAVICRVFGPALCSTAKTIAWLESRWKTRPCCNPTHFGLFQLDQNALDAYAKAGYSTVYQQVLAAFRMYKARGWEPWTCCEG